MTVAEQLLKELPREYALTAINSIAIQRGQDWVIKEFDISTSQIIDGCFIWTESPEGPEFWNKVVVAIEEKTPLPPFP